MIALYDHIQQLRAELRGCYMTRRERAAVQAELAKALAEQAELDRAFDRALEALCKQRRVSHVQGSQCPPSWQTAGSDVYVGRPSKWGNPFVIGRDGSREEVIAKYRAWIVRSGRSWRCCTSCAARTSSAGARPSAATRKC
jgi:hypothetical protein